MTHHRNHQSASQRAHSGRASNSSQSSSSAAAQYAKFKQRQQHRTTAAFRFEQSLAFDLDPFQQRAIEALESGNNVLVAAPTGAGKTVVADFAMFLAQQRNVKAFYTAPIKALSNQKYHDLVDVYGTDRVGLLTGDISINANADIVVMTTEVLRNMLYEHSTALEALQFVVLDEIHYLADRFRGAVWEEVLIHLPQSVSVVGLSATVSNVEDFCGWLTSIRGDTKLIVSEERPVALEQHVMLQQDDRHPPELFDLYGTNRNGKQTNRVNASLVARLSQLDHASQATTRNHAQYRFKQPSRKGKETIRRHTPKRWAVVDELEYRDLLPGIMFIFSRSGCERAVDQCLRAGLRLTSDNEAKRIRKFVDEMVSGYDRQDLKALGFSNFRFALEEGFAAHHAGMVTLFRQIVEQLFEAGLVKMVFATETLALGINMPARSVVLEKLEKFDGLSHVSLTPGQYTQLTGRAGRRGIDTLGHAIVVDHHDFAPAALASLSSKRVYPLHSSFKPTNNMAVNLLYGSDAATARQTLDHSYAQWEANNSAWQLEAHIDTLQKAISGYESAMHCEYGDVTELLRIRMRIHDLEHNDRRRLRHALFNSEQDRHAAIDEVDRTIATLRKQDAQHPCRSCPDLEQHMRWGHRWSRESRELERLQKQYRNHTGSVARAFDRICSVLGELGYLQKQGEDLLVTQRGQLLRHIYCEQDIVLIESIFAGLFDKLDESSLAAVLSCIVSENRLSTSQDTYHYPGGSHGVIAKTLEAVGNIDERVSFICQDHEVEEPQSLDNTYVTLIFDWASGKPLAEVLRGSDITGGDFVRHAQRLVDLLQQIANAEHYLAGHEVVAHTATKAARWINRGIVAYSGLNE